MPLVSTFSSGSSRSLGLGSGIRPGAPTITGISYLNGTTGGRLEVSFTAGTVGTTATTDYQYSLNNGTTWTTRSGTASPVVITGLTNGTSYTIRLRAVNSIGASEQSNSTVGRPIALPGAPSVSVTMHPTDLGKINVAVTAGTAGTDSLNGTTPYEYSLNSGSTWTTVSSANFTISGLANETSYTVTVRAITTNNDRSSSGSGTGSTRPIAPYTARPTATKNGSSFNVTWGAITDVGSGVASATVIQTFIGSSSGYVSGSTYSIPSGSFSGGTVTMSVPSNRRNTPSGETWQVTYQIYVVDNVGTTFTSEGSFFEWTRPLGTYNIGLTDADSFGTNWANFAVADEAVVRRSTTWSYGAFFYGTQLPDTCKGFAADSGTIFVKRAGSTAVFRGNTGTFTFRVHDRTSASGAASFSGTEATAYLSGDNASTYVSMPSDWLSAFANSTAYGVALTNHSNQPGGLRGLSDFSGLITLVFN